MIVALFQQNCIATSQGRQISVKDFQLLLNIGVSHLVQRNRLPYFTVIIIIIILMNVSEQTPF